jgi:antitoxin component YwqK of YwqJK toxin-antitoxin module
MLLKRLFAGSFILLWLFSSSNAQTTQTYYDAYWKKCDASKACYLSVKEKTDSGYFRKDYFISSGKVQMIALFEDSSCKVQNGYGLFFYANGYLRRSVKMIHGKKEGVVEGYYNNGQMSDSGTYHNGLPVGDVLGWHNNGFISDSVAHVNDSTSVHVSWFDNGIPAAAGKEINGKKNGAWVFYHQNGNKAAREVYEKGKRISLQHFAEDGTEIAVDTSRNEHPAEFKGGIPNWRRYLEKTLQWPYGYHFENTSQVVLQVEMTVDEQGNITDVYVVNPFHPAFDKVAYNVVSKSPKWTPAIQHNRLVKYRFTQSITFEERL